MSARGSLSPVLLGRVASPPHLLSPQTIGTLPSGWSSSMDHEVDMNSSSRADVEEAVTDGNSAPAPDARPIVTAQDSPRDEAELPQHAGAPMTEPQTQATETTTMDTTETADTAPASAASDTIQSEPEGGERPTTEPPVPASAPTEPQPQEADTVPAIQEQDAAQVQEQEQEQEQQEQQQEEQEEQEPEASPPEAEDEVPDWVKFEEDTSTPDEEELKEIENSEDDKRRASHAPDMEKLFFWDVETPEMRPVKKMRLSWLIKGVRGTKEHPNHSRVMHSPGAFIDGFYWSIKFYPRGESCSSLSAFIRCSTDPPPVDEEGPESYLTCFEGSPEADFTGDIKPTLELHAPFREHKKPKAEDSNSEKPAGGEVKATGEDISSEEPSETPTPTSLEKSDVDLSGTEKKAKESPNWRLSAQLGVVIYNPKESRTMYVQHDGHQFSKHCDDWGWVDFVRPWDQIHLRKRGQRRPLLQEDTIAIDAYVRIYNDPTEALWWHESTAEPQWPSKDLAGYFPMGTPGLYHSPAVAGITAWMLLAPFREVIQAADGGQWRTDSNIEPKPLICQSQLVLDQMRNLSNDGYVNLYGIIEEFLEASERWNDVKSFWEVFRRGLEIEFTGDQTALGGLSSIFDVNGSHFPMPSLPVPGSPDVQRGLAKYFDEQNTKSAFPNFLPVMLDRQQFDSRTREWKLHHDKVLLNDELDLSHWCSDRDATYILYGFIAHVGGRNSGKFYSVLRPGGINTKWLAFEDGNGNKVFSYSTKRVKEYEGLEDKALKSSATIKTRENAYLAMYVRSGCFKEYLADGLQPYKVPKWLKPWTDDARGDDGDENCEEQEALATQASIESPKPDEENCAVELYLDECAKDSEDMLNLHDLRMSPHTRQMRRTLMVGKEKTVRDVRRAVSQAFGLEDHHKIALWEIHYQGLGKFSRAVLEPISYRKKIAEGAAAGQVLRLWVTVRQSISEQVPYSHLLDQLDELDLSHKPIEQLQEEAGVSTQTCSPNDNTVQSSSETQASSTENEEALSGPDAEQASVQDAVAVDIQGATEVHENSGDVAEVTATATVVLAEQNADVTLDLSEPASGANNTGDETDHPLSTTESILDSPPEGVEGESTRPVVHGHLIDAAEHPPTTSEIVIVQATANVPHGDVAALAQVLAEEIVAVDTLEVVSDNVDESVPAPVPAPDEAEGRARAPAPAHAPRGYGCIQRFDADQQKFVAQRYFHPELESEVGGTVRKIMGFDDAKEIRVWKRHGASGTEPLPLTTKFVNAVLQGPFTLIVGDVLSNDTVDKLKLTGKFWQPQQLMRYLFMSQRRHPYLSLTSTEPIETAEFGNNYYKGPLIRGQPHGENGLLITSSGHTYEGPFIAGQKSGANGKITYQNGDTYVGEWFNDERHGQGEFVEKRTGNRYVGGFENGKRWGAGTTYWQMADQQADMCQICYEEDIDALFYDCGHVCACFACAKQCDSCPICRRSVRQVVKMYRA